MNRFLDILLAVMSAVNIGAAGFIAVLTTLLLVVAHQPSAVWHYLAALSFLLFGVVFRLARKLL